MRLRLGTRRSALALAQSGLVARQLERLHEGLEVELVPIVTEGDRTLGDLAKAGGKGLFTEELEGRILAGDIDFAVHSLKDLPVRLPAGLGVAAYPSRADARDVLISASSSTLEALPQGARVLTGSLRRRALLLRARPDLRVEPVRGNIDTRIRKWQESGAEGVILAAAGLERLPEAARDLPIRSLNPQVILPAPGQGTLALEAADGSVAAALCAKLNDAQTERASETEREVVAAFGGDCTLPLAAWCRHDQGSGLRLTAFLSTPDAGHSVEHEAIGAEPAELAAEVVDNLRSHGADDILAMLRT